jgi:uncharacterized surface protein with fasciclin (FAS1) repeats
MKNLPSLLALSVALLLSTASGFAEDKAPVRKETLLDTVTELHKKGFNTLVAAITKTDYLDKVASGTYTVLAPTDVAFRDLPKAQLDALLADKEKLTAVLSHHLVEGKVSTADLKAGKVKTLGGSEVSAKVVDGKLKIGAATVVKPDLGATNGVIHGIDKILQQ